MNEVLYDGFVTITPWKIIGWTGAFLFAARWFVQLYASKHAGRPTFPRAFWVISIVGSFLTLSYFIWGKNDSVGIIQNLFPFFVASYNFSLDLGHRRRNDLPAKE